MSAETPVVEPGWLQLRPIVRGRATVLERIWAAENRGHAY